MYVSTGLKGHKRAQEPRSSGLSTRGHGSYTGDKPPVFTLVDRGSNSCFVVPAKSTNESTVRLLLDNHEQESLTVYTDGFQAYKPLGDDDTYDRQSSSTATVNTLMTTFTSPPATVALAPS